MSLKIIGAGFGRTGTTSLKAALEQLGFTKCHHMTEVFKHPSQASRFLDAWHTQTADWDQLFEGYQATTDWPGCSHYQTLLEAYPDAKVILTQRDPERWHASCMNTIYRANTDVPTWFKFIFRRYRMVQELAYAQIWRDTFDGRFTDKEHALGVFEAHNQGVIESVPAERLLIFEVKQGWEPLCKFLDVPVPDTPFPHLNDGKLMSRFFDTLPYVPWILCGILISTVLALYWWLF